MAIKPRVSEVQGEEFEYSGTSLWTKFVETVHTHADNIAVAATHQPSGHLGFPNIDLLDAAFQQTPYLRLQYRHLGHAVNRFANALLERKVQPGTPVFSFLPNMVELGIAMWATWKIGCIWVPINPKHILNRQEVSHMVNTALSVKASKSAVVLVVDGNVADGLDELNVECEWMKILASTEKKDGWENFQDVFASAPESHPQNPSFETQVGSDPMSVFFTSGTTSLPKGVVRHLDWHAYSLEQRLFRNSHVHEDTIFLVAPNNHAFANTWYILAHATGATIVHAGPAFQAQILMDTLQREPCTRISLVPTMVHALLDAKARMGGIPVSVHTIGLSGAMVNPEIVNKCITDLGAQRIENQWGMTEGCVTATHDVPISSLYDGDFVSVGYAPPGARARVCEPNSTTPLPIGVPGEFHFSTGSMAKEYINRASSDFYFDEDGRQWFITGDQASIDEQGRIFITGRYKEMIIRGGENIAPAAIETVLMQVPELLLLNVQIVGAKDSVAGEVPVAVYASEPDATLARLVQQTVLEKIGPAHVPDQVISLTELGLDDYPRTTSGKIQKNKLAITVQEFRNKEEESTMGASYENGELATVIKRIWKRALGYEVDETLSFAAFADSITIMRTRDMISKATGKQVSLEDMNEAENIAGQIRMLQEKPEGVQVKRPKRAQREGPITEKDVVLFQHRPSTFSEGKKLIESMLAPHDLGWDDIADIAPAYDFCTMLNQSGVMDSWNVTFAWTTNVKNPEDGRNALRKTLANIPIFTSFFLWDKKVFKTDGALHVIMKQTDAYLDRCVHDFGTVKTLQDVREMADKYPIKNAATLSGPLADAGYVFVEETQTVALLCMLNHAIMDASCVLILNDDLENALGGQPLPEHIDYKTWADSHYTLRNSLDAQIATEWYVDRLRGISEHRQALWVDLNGPKESEGDYGHQFDVPDLLKLRQRFPELTAPVIVKAAFALMNSYESKHTHALFSNYQASRERFPFVPKALDSLGYDYSAANVAGQTIELATNFVEVKLKETVLDFFFRMQIDQDNQTKYAAAPMREVTNQLGEADGSMIIDTLKAVAFNWVPGFGSGSMNSYDNLDNLAMIMHLDDGFGMTVGLGGERGHTVFIEFYGAMLSMKKQKELAKYVEAITTWLVDERNWNRHVGGYLPYLEGVKANDVSAENGQSTLVATDANDSNGVKDAEGGDGMNWPSGISGANPVNGVQSGTAVMV